MTLTKILTLVLALLALAVFTGCDPTIDVAFQTGNALNQSHHDIAIAISGPGLVENLGPFSHPQHQTYVREFETSHSKQTDVDVIFTFTDLATGQIVTKSYRLNVSRTTDAMATDRHFGR